MLAPHTSREIMDFQKSRSRAMFRGVKPILADAAEKITIKDGVIV